MGTNTIIRRKYRSNIVILVFITTTIIGGLLSEIYQAPKNNAIKFNRYISLFSNFSIENINKIVLENKLGNFIFSRNQNFENMWELESPRKLPANQVPITNIINALKKIKVREIYKPDQINKSNFSLDKPQASLTLLNNKGESSMVKYGLVNSIDKSIYISVSGHHKIYHIDSLKHTPELLDLQSLINTSIFPFNKNNITKITLSKFNKKIETVNINIIKNGGEWYNASNKLINQEKVYSFISKLTSINSQAILDDIDKKLQLQIDKQISNPLYKIIIELDREMNITYLISHPLRSLSGLKIEKWKTFIIKPSNHPYVYLLARENLKAFSKNQKHFNALDMKKLFY